MTDKAPTSAMILIGNELLSGRTKDTNMTFVGKELAEIGVRLMEARVVPDVEEEIVKAVNELRKKYDYVFTTGGIGPTHDDITSECIAKAFGLKYTRHKEAEAILLAHYKPDQVNESRMKMADMPEGARLIPNPMTSAPGFAVENVYVMAGVPVIMQAMFRHVMQELKRGAKIQSITVTTDLREGDFAAQLGDLQKKYPTVDIGSYPAFGTNADYTVAVLVKGTDAPLLEQCAKEVAEMFLKLGGSANRLVSA